MWRRGSSRLAAFKPRPLPSHNCSVAHCLSGKLSIDRVLFATTPPRDQGKVVKTDEEWKKILSPLQYDVCRNRGTERPWSCEKGGEGTYHCVCCGSALFRSTTKFESGSGWPSFFQPIDNTAIIEKEDISHGMVRIEVCCARCDAHLGHVFSDGPPPTGRRYCINGVCLELLKKEEETK